MNSYKLFKRNESVIKFLIPNSLDNKLSVAKLITESTPVMIGYKEKNDEDTESERKYLEIFQCPRIYIGDKLNCKNVETGVHEYLGEIVDFDFRDGIGFLFIFE